MNNLRLTNSLTRKKEVFKPINLDKITLYVCGPTVYDNPHVGNARSLVVFDTLFRVLQLLYGGKKVYYVRNITDVDDKIIEASKNKKKPINDITQEVTKIFHQNCESLNCLKPTQEPKATEHIHEMIEMTSSLIKKKFAYVNGGHVYFSVTSFKSYGKLSNKNLEDLKAGSRVEISDLKKNPMDFVLWKPSAEKDPGWPSPWGRGRPGWHLECSVMSEKYLGKNFDIHGGGLDLIFPHHENEIAQSCSNNSTNLLSAHYSQPLDWNDNLLNNQKNILDKWYNLYEKNSEEIQLDFVETLLDDLNTAGFIAKIHELYNEAIEGDNKKKALFNSACRLLGLFNVTKEEWLNLKKKKVKISEELILKKIQERKEAKNNRNYDLADKIRNELLDEGILIEDQKEKTIWKFK